MNAPFVIQAGLPVEFYEPGDFFRILASAGPVDVRFYRQGVEVGEALQVTEGYAERWRGLGFDRFIIASGTTQTLQVVARLGSDVYFDAPPVGSTDIVSSVPLALDAATLAAIDANMRAAPLPVRVDQLPGGNWANTAQVVANTPISVFLAAANPNGAIIHALEAFDVGAAVNNQVFIAKATAPANVTDGVIVAQALPVDAPGNVYMAIKRDVPVRIPAGLGLYFIASTGGSVGVLRSARYTLL